MKTYKTYLYFFFDETIEEENTHHQTLTKSFGDKTVDDNFHCWLGHCPDLDISTILDTIWFKEDVDIFVKENPECKGLHFTVYRENRNFGERNWEKYCPLQENRDTKIHQIING